MASESDSQPKDSQESLKSSVRRLQSEMRELSESAHQLLTEKMVLENEVAQVKKRASRLEEEIRNLRSPPMIIGGDLRFLISSSSLLALFFTCATSFSRTIFSVSN